MNISKDNNNGVEGCNGFDMGATTHLRSRPLEHDKLFILGNGMAVNKKLLNKYFPIIVGRSSKVLYTMLCVIYAHPLRTVYHITECCLSNGTTVNKNLLILMDMGYIQQENKPRLIIPFNSWTIDKVYRITSKGVKALSAITGY